MKLRFRHRQRHRTAKGCLSMFRLFLLIHFYDKSNSCFFATRETNISERLHCPLLFYRKKKRIILVFQNKSLLLQYPRGEILGSRMRFLLLPENRNRQFQEEGWKQCNAHSVCISHKYSPRCASQGIYDSVGYLFLSSFSSRCLAIPDFR